MADGSINNPLNSIQEAIARAYELGAPYTSATITVLLLDYGYEHYMARYNPSNYYTPTKYDTNSQTTSIILDTSSGN